jgi:hypothetical protein
VIAAAVLTILVVTGRGGFEYDDPFETFPADQPRGSAPRLPGPSGRRIPLSRGLSLWTGVRRHTSTCCRARAGPSRPNHHGRHRPGDGGDRERARGGARPFDPAGAAGGLPRRCLRGRRALMGAAPGAPRPRRAYRASFARTRISKACQGPAEAAQKTAKSGPENPLLATFLGVPHVSGMPRLGTFEVVPWAKAGLGTGL